MGNRARMMGFAVLDAIDNIKQFSDLEAHLRQNFFPHRRYPSLGVPRVVAEALKAAVVVLVRRPADTLVFHCSIQQVCLRRVQRTDNSKSLFDFVP